MVWGDHVFVNAVDHEKKEIHAICLSASTGKILWSHVVGKGRVHLDDRSDFSSPSPVTDGKHVAFFFGNADLIVYDMKGKEVWQRNLVPEGDKYFAFQSTFSVGENLAGNLRSSPPLPLKCGPRWFGQLAPVAIRTGKRESRQKRMRIFIRLSGDD